MPTAPSSSDCEEGTHLSHEFWKKYVNQYVIALSRQTHNLKVVGSRGGQASDSPSRSSLPPSAAAALPLRRTGWRAKQGRRPHGGPRIKTGPKPVLTNPSRATILADPSRSEAKPTKFPGGKAPQVQSFGGFCFAGPCCKGTQREATTFQTVTAIAGDPCDADETWPRHAGAERFAVAFDKTPRILAV